MPHVDAKENTDMQTLPFPQTVYDANIKERFYGTMKELITAWHSGNTASAVQIRSNAGQRDRTIIIQ
jgi:hypothetical protein